MRCFICPAIELQLSCFVNFLIVLLPPILNQHRSQFITTSSSPKKVCLAVLSKIEMILKLYSLVNSIFFSQNNLIAWHGYGR